MQRLCWNLPECEEFKEYCTIFKYFSLLLPCATATFCYKYHEICERGCEKFIREITLLKLVCNSNDIAPCMRS